jgi:nucleoid-associated protein YgaU
MQLPKATAAIREVDNPLIQLTFHFNPTTLSFSKSAEFKRQPSQGASGGPQPQFLGTQATTLRMQILLDAVEKQPAGSVQAEVEQLLKWTSTDGAPGDPAPSPPELRFTWGALTINGGNTFTGHLKQVDVTYELFARDGRPIRAQVSLTLESTPAPLPQTLPMTNPTSGGERARRSHVLRRGEALHSIAFATYGEAARWRDIARVNGIDNPFRLTPGLELLLPDASELAGG